MSASPLRRAARRLTGTLAASATLLAGLAAVAPAATATAAAMVNDSGCGATSLPRNDDDSSPQVTLPNPINFFGTTHSTLYVNNNGNVTFSEPMSSFTPFAIGADTPPILAAFFADVDTTSASSALTTWGNVTFEGHSAFCVNWRGVGYFLGRADKTNDVQLLVVDRSDIAPGDFDVVYNYGRIQWEAGEASGGTGGLGGTSAGVGFSSGASAGDAFYDMPGSRTPGSFLDSGTTPLVNGSRNSATPGRFVFPFRSGRAAGITPAQTTITLAPPTDTNTTSPQITYSANPVTGSTFECRLTTGTTGSGAYASCPPSGWTPPASLPEGTYTFDVRATDSYGVTDPTPASRTFTVDTTVPGTSISSGRTGTSNQTTATYSYAATGGDAGTATFQCRLTRSPATPAAFAACPSGVRSYTNLADGDYTFEVRAVDRAGNADPNPQVRTFTVDTTAPSGIAFTDGPQGPVSSRNGSFTWGAPAGQGVSSWQCRLVPAGGNPTWTSCDPSTGVTFGGLADGAYTFETRATDGAGNTSAVAQRSFTVDTVVPGTSISTGRTGSSNSTSATFVYGATGGDAGTATYRCRLTRTGDTPAAFATCPSPATYTGLADGEYTFEVVSVDQAGNIDPTPQTRVFTVDTTPPAGVTFEGGPQGPVGSPDVTFTWGAPAGQDIATWECRLVGPDGAAPAWTTCDPHGTSFTGLPDGEYYIETRATDTTGNVSVASRRTFRVDTVAPQSNVTGGTTGTVKGSNVSFSYASDDVAEGTTFECRLVGPGQPDVFVPCPAGGAEYAGLADGQYTFEVRAVDAAGNRGAVQQTPFRVNELLPTITATITSTQEAPANGWYSQPVRIVFTCDAAGSTWTKACPAPKRVARGSTDRVITRTVRTADGDRASVSVKVNIDRYKPWALRAKGLDTTRTYHAVPRNLRCKATDRRSGVDSCRLRTRVSKDGDWLLVRLKATDEAGNVRTKVVKAPFRGRRA